MSSIGDIVFFEIYMSLSGDGAANQNSQYCWVALRHLRFIVRLYSDLGRRCEIVRPLRAKLMVRRQAAAESSIKFDKFVAGTCVA
jgi:hypothetical protein